MTKCLTVAAVLLCGSLATAQPVADVAPDTIALDVVEVLATRASTTTPVAFSILDRTQLDRDNTGRDIPFLLTTTPSVLTTSDAGAGVGYTSLRVRGTDATRINITTNDIPMNDPESHSIFWVNTPDLVASLADVQVQRGAGTSTNGSGAFGASVNMRTKAFSNKPYALVDATYGSFATNKQSVAAGSGLLHGHWGIEARLSHIGSNGYRDRASSKLYSYFVQVGFRGGNTQLRFITFGGKEETYHAWDGISREQLEEDRTYNPNGEIKHNGKVTGFYDDQKDFYRQIHYQLIINQRLSDNWRLNAALHFTDGYGYYKEYKNARTLKEYGLEPFEHDGVMVKKSSLVRKKVNDGNFGGGVWSLHYVLPRRLTLTLGGGVNHFFNRHVGNVLWLESYVGTLAPDHEYYRNRGEKTDFNIYLKGNYNIVGGLSAYADLQYRHISYRIRGVNDTWDWTATPEHMQTLDVNEKFNFFNPKAGLNYQINDHHRAYFSFAVAQKEPTRNNYTDGPLLEHPRAERLLDYELGYAFSSERFSAGVNGYFMDYRDQLVLNGKLNEIGEAMAENVPKSYRMGVELTAGWKATRWLRWDVNATLSRNRIKDYVGYVGDYNADTWDDMYTQTAITRKSTTISFSPSFTAGSLLTATWRGFTASLQSQYVSRQYLDNFQNKEDSLDPYFVNHLTLSYAFALRGVERITLGVTVYNLFNERYETNGYSQTAALYKGGDKTQQPVISSDPRFYPMAGTHAMGRITINF